MPKGVKRCQRCHKVSKGCEGVSRGVWVSKGVKGWQGASRGVKGLSRVVKGFQGVPEGSKGFQGVPSGFKSFQGVSRGFQGFQWVSMGIKGYQVVSMRIKGYQGVPKVIKGCSKCDQNVFKWCSKCGAEGWVGRQNFALFFPLPPLSLFLCLSGCLLVEFWWCFGRSGPQMCLFSPSGCRVEAPLPQPPPSTPLPPLTRP